VRCGTGPPQSAAARDGLFAIALGGCTRAIAFDGRRFDGRRAGRAEQTTSASSACVRATPLPTISLAKPSAEALRTRGRSSSSGLAVVFTITRS
jgi:hypothetical protein